MSGISRRQFVFGSLAAGSAAAATFAAGSHAAAAAPARRTDGAARRPNIIWIQTDEQRPDSLGCYGSAWARTPNLDCLAARGTVFHECHVQSPVCVPCRTSMLSGRYPQETGVFDNTKANKDGVLAPGLKMFPNLFADAGYRTASFGKWHTPKHPTWQTNNAFDIFHNVVGYYELPAPYSESEHRVVKRPGASPIILGGIYPYHDWGTTISSHVTDLAIAWLREAAAAGEPFLLRVSHVWPHTPVLVPRPWDAIYDPDRIPCNGGDTAANREAFAGRAAYDRQFAAKQKGMEIPVETWRRICADYYGLCAHVDHEVGRLMRVVEELGLTGNTIIAYNADHGKSLGEAGLCEKGTFDREVWRVPFLLSWPGVIPEGEHRRDLMELIDFGPTLFALAGLRPDPGRHGRNLFDSRESEAVYGVIDLGPFRRAAVRTRRYRFDCTLAIKGESVGYEACDPNLFDLAQDPGEIYNLAAGPETKAVRKELYDRIRRWMRDPASVYS
ncbi:MAG: sulfatase-like hydrolase/transferase [bacterium]|nr:sulfatase-like hydrolase/transferase [bacterium]